MFWHFGFSSTSTLDTLLDRQNVTLEEILDEDELLQECKGQNSKLINYLQQPRVLKRLFEHVVGTAEVGGSGGREWEEKVRFKYPYIASEVLSSDIWSIIDTALSHSDELLTPFWDTILSSGSTVNPPTVTQHQHPLFSADAPIPPGPRFGNNASRLSVANAPTITGEEHAESSSMGVLGLEPKTNDEGNTVTSARDNGPGKSVLAGYWAKVNGVFLDKKPREMITFIRSLPHIVELFVAHMETPAVVDLLYRIVQCEEAVPNIGVIDWLSAQSLMPSLIELLSPSHSADLHNTVSELLKAIIALSAPSPASLTQASGTEAFGFSGTDSLNNQSNGQVGGVNNRLVRELASEAVVRKMVSFMLDASLSSRLQRRLSEAADEQQQTDSVKALRSRPSAVAATRGTLTALSEDTTTTDKGGSNSSNDSALDDEELEFEAGTSRRPLNPRDTPASEQSSLSRTPGGLFDHRDSTATIRPSTTGLTPVHAPEVAVTPESCTSTLVTCIGVLIELIRKNNSDYFEQHLFHTLRTHLLQRQQEIAERKQNKTTSTTGTAEDEEAPPAKEDNDDDEDDDEMEGMEEAMAELSDKLGIVHLGPMLRVLCERLPDFQVLVSRPLAHSGTTKTLNGIGAMSSLTFERYRITELYAELLHCSNMALLNRQPSEGPQYSDEGVLQGGIEGLQILARTLQGTDASSDSGQDHNPEDRAAHVDAEEQSSVAPEPSTEEGGSTLDLATDVSLPRKGKHTRESSTTGVAASGNGGNGSEDTDDEALLSEVSLNETAGHGASSSIRIPSSTAPTTAESSTAEERGYETVEAMGDETTKADDEIKSVLSNLSLADLTSPSPAPSGPPSPINDARAYVVGDLLKKKFLECEVIPTILSLFFEYPWNNFLHNVVYDILQQFFNGRMDIGLNRRLTLAVFEQGRLPEKIVEGHRRNEESLKTPRRIRMGYMGHMHLIAEETVKLLERYPQEIARLVEPTMSAEWTRFVTETLKENREREAAPLAGGRPQMMQPLGFAQQSGADGDLGAGNDGNVGGTIGGNGPSSTSEPFASYLSSQMGGANASDDDDSDEDTNWVSQDLRQRATNARTSTGGGADGFDDSFTPSAAVGVGRRGLSDGDTAADDDDDDDWGPFADSAGHALSSAQAYQTPADWAAEFQREASANDRFEDGDMDMGDDEEAVDASEGDSNSSSTSGGGRTNLPGEASRSRTGSDGSDASASGTPFVDLLDSASLRATDVVAAAHARRPSLEHLEGVVAPDSIRIARPRGASVGPPSLIGSSDPSAGDAIQSPDEPFGPGVHPDAQADHVSGRIERTIDGETVTVPLDEVALVAGPASPSSQTDDAEEAVVIE